MSSDSNHVLVKAAEARRVLGGISHPHLIKIEKLNSKFPRPIWMHGTRFYWLDQIHAYIESCADNPRPHVSTNLRPRRARNAA